MIVVEVKLISAITGEHTVLSRVIIDNIKARDGGKLCDYRTRAYRKGVVPEWPYERGVFREARVYEHRRYDKHVLELVAKSLAAMGFGPGAAPKKGPT